LPPASAANVIVRRAHNDASSGPADRGPPLTRTAPERRAGVQIRCSAVLGRSSSRATEPTPADSAGAPDCPNRAPLACRLVSTERPCARSADLRYPRAPRCKRSRPRCRWRGTLSSPVRGRKRLRAHRPRSRSRTGHRRVKSPRIEPDAAHVLGAAPVDRRQILGRCRSRGIERELVTTSQRACSLLRFEVTVAAEHFDKRKVELGTCGRPYGTPCQHEHACIPRPKAGPEKSKASTSPSPSYAPRARTPNAASDAPLPGSRSKGSRRPPAPGRTTDENASVDLEHDHADRSDRGEAARLLRSASRLSRHRTRSLRGPPSPRGDR
jgi:hypothetical protein